jgi:short subunit dehydrogenase-like uncharacterized protein
MTGSAATPAGGSDGSSTAIVLFGATGYTGRLVAASLVRAGASPLLVGRDQGKLRRLAGELGGLDVPEHTLRSAPLDFAVADVTKPATLRSLLGPGDVLVTTVGPFLRHGKTALRAAIDAGAIYIDSTGEPPFVRRVFLEESDVAAASGAALLPAFGYDYVPGNLAGALALAQAGQAAARVDVGYFLTGRTGGNGVSTGTLASAAGVLLEPSFAWRGGRLVEEGSAASLQRLALGLRGRQGVPVGGTEHFALPRIAPQLREVNVELGWFGPLWRLVQVGAAVTALVARLPGAGHLVEALATNLASRTGGGPDARERSRSGTAVTATAYDAAGHPLSEVRLEGPNGYTFTGDMLAWAARRAAEHGVAGRGALGPVDAFGLAALQAGCAEAGLVPV